MSNAVSVNFRLGRTLTIMPADVSENTVVPVSSFA